MRVRVPVDKSVFAGRFRLPIVAALVGVGALVGIPGVFSVAATAPASGRERMLIDADWRFHRGDLMPGGTGAAIARWKWRVETNKDAATPIAAEGAEWKDAIPGQDVFNGRRGFAWYIATLGEVPSKDGKRILHFEAVDDNATVYLNGTRLVHHEGWDEAFDVPLDAAWKAGRPNVITVLVENTNGAGNIGEADIRAEIVADPPAASPDYPDRDWRTLHLPHDFVVEGTFTEGADVGHGSLPKDVGWYRHTFALPASDKGRRISLDFDGIYRDAMVWVNGKRLGNHKSGYIGARFDITDVANFGGQNTIVVRADARKSEGWWYEGGGIYRHVWLTKMDPLHIAPDGIYANATVNGDPTAAHPSATVAVTVEVRNDGATAADSIVVSKLLDPSGRTVATAERPLTISPGQTATAALSIDVSDARLWSPETPQLYRLETSIQGFPNRQVLDRGETPFGIRTFRFDAEKGFFLNGKPVKLKGTCNHQDFAGVGIAMPDGLLDWRIKKLKDMGSNAYRCSHNPVASELLDACDRQGMLVMDETRHLGDTYTQKTGRGTKTDDLSDLATMIRRDRNHPSIIIWSLANEEPLQGSEEGARIFQAMRQVVAKYDKTRPLSSAMNGGWGSGITLVEDLQGINYSPGAYDGFHKNFPNKPLFGSETASTVSTRGIYENDKERGYVSAYDANFPGWAQTAENAWRPIAERSYVAGGFVWTGFDYKGEPTPYGWPCINSHFGIMDMCGFPKDNWWYYRAWWGDTPVVHLLPHWNWQGKEGQPISVWCQGNAARVEVFLNGKTLAAKEMPRYGHLEWSVPYAPGVLEAKGYDDKGKVIASDRIETTGPPVALRLTTETPTVEANGEEVGLVTVEVVDAKGRVVPVADIAVTFTVSGPAFVAGVGNGDPSSHEPDKAQGRKAFNGKCMAIVQSSGAATGNATVTATAPGLQKSTLTLKVVRPTARLRTMIP